MLRYVCVCVCDCSWVSSEIMPINIHISRMAVHGHPDLLIILVL